MPCASVVALGSRRLALPGGGALAVLGSTKVK